jgi:hypothetical protein
VEGGNQLTLCGIAFVSLLAPILSAAEVVLSMVELELELAVNTLGSCGLFDSESFGIEEGCM